MKKARAANRNPVMLGEIKRRYHNIKDLQREFGPLKYITHILRDVFDIKYRSGQAIRIPDDLFDAVKIASDLRDRGMPLKKVREFLGVRGKRMKYKINNYKNMNTFSAKQFKLRYGHKPGAIFNLEKFMTDQVKSDVEKAGKPVLQMLFGSLAAQPDVHYALEVNWTIGTDGILKGDIWHVRIFKNEAEQEGYREKIRRDMEAIQKKQ